MNYEDAPPGFEPIENFSDAPPGFTPVEKPDYENMSYSEAFSRGKKKFFPTQEEAEAFAHDVSGIWGPKRAIIDPAINMGKVVLGAAEKGLGFKPEQQISNEQEVAGDLWDRIQKYGTSAGRKELIAEDPGGVAVDVLGVAAPVKLARKGVAPKPDPKIATGADLKQWGGAGLNVVRNSGVYFDKSFASPFAQTLNQTAYDMGFRPGRRGTAGLVGVMKDVSALDKKPVSFREIHELDQDLNDVIVTQPGTTNAAIARKMKGVIDQFMEKVEQGNGQGLIATGNITPAQAANYYKNSLAAYHQGKKVDRVAALLEKADVDSWLYTQSGIAPQIKKHFRQVYKDPKKMVGFSPEERALIKDIATGTLTDKALQLGSKLAIRGVVSAGTNALLGTTLGGPTASILLAGAGELSKRAFDRRTRGKAENLLTHMRTKGSDNLKALLGDATYDQVIKTPAGKNALASWLKNKGGGTTNRALSFVVANAIGRPDMQPQIQAELEAQQNQDQQ